jgi:hypothetical protein
MASTSMPGACAEKERLLREYQTAAEDYSRAVRALSERSGVMSKASYIEIRDYSEAARAKAEAARNAMDRHVAEHGCWARARLFRVTPPESECPESIELLVPLKSAIDAITDLNKRQLEAAMAGNLSEVQALAGELRREQRRKESLLNAYMTHVRTHGC